MSHFLDADCKNSYPRKSVKGLVVINLPDGRVAYIAHVEVDGKVREVDLDASTFFELSESREPYKTTSTPSAMGTVEHQHWRVWK